MKGKLLLGVLGIAVFLVVGTPNLKTYSTSKDSLATLQGQNALFESTVSELQPQLEALKADVDLDGKTEWLDASAMLTKMHTLTGGELLESYPAMNDLELLSDTVNALECKYTITDIDAFITSLKDANVPVEQISIDCDDGIAIVSVRLASSAESIESNVVGSDIEFNENPEKAETELYEEEMLYDEELSTEVGGINETTDY